MNNEERSRKVLIISVNYKGASGTLRFLDSLRHLEGFSGVDVTVVDNASRDESPSLIRDAISDLNNVNLLESATNRGYFGAAKWALTKYLDGQKSVPDWVIVCNNDIVIEDREFLGRLFEREPAAVGVLAPTIRSEYTRLDQNPFLRARPDKKKLRRIRIWFSSYYLMLLKTVLSNPVRLGREKIRRLISPHQDTSPDRALHPIYSPHGAFVIFSRKYFELGGQIDDGLLLYTEEFSVAETCRRLGLNVFHDAELQVQHREHQTTGANLSRLTYKRKKDALNYVISKYLSDLT